MIPRQPLQSLRRIAFLALLLLAGGCGGLLPKAPPPPQFYALDGGASASTLPVSNPGGLTLIVSPLTAAPGYDSARIVYVQQLHQLAHFAHSEWVDTPARMLAPQVVAAMAASGVFAAVVAGPAGAAGDLRLDLALLRLQHEFTGPQHQVRLTLRATLVDTATRRVRLQRLFDHTVGTTRDDAYAGVLAANQATAEVLRGLVSMASQTVSP